jgi:hypothetical protein
LRGDLGSEEELRTGLKAIGIRGPAALGVQEDGYVVVRGLYGLTPEVGIACRW